MYMLSSVVPEILPYLTGGDTRQASKIPSLIAKIKDRSISIVLTRAASYVFPIQPVVMHSAPPGKELNPFQ
jgi:hypothetical protein